MLDFKQLSTASVPSERQTHLLAEAFPLPPVGELRVLGGDIRGDRLLEPILVNDAGRLRKRSASVSQLQVRASQSERGFKIVDFDGSVSVELAGDHFWVRSGGNAERFVGLYAYRGLVAAIAVGLIADWRPRGELPSRWLRSWKLEKTRRIFGKSVHAEWLRLLEQVDPRVLAVQRAIFAATFDQSASPLPTQAYADRHIVHDVVTYRAAAVVASRLGELTEIVRRERLERASRRIQESEGLRCLAEEHGVEVEMLRVVPALRGPAAPPAPYAPYAPAPAVPASGEPRVPADLDIALLRDWRGTLSHDGAPYRSLNRTLDQLPGAIPVPLVLRLRQVMLERPIRQRLELLALLHAAGRSRVPAPATATVGREREIAEVRRLLLSRPTGLVSLVGPGGVGKTRLAVESAAAVGAELADGAVMVELAPLRDHELLLPSIGHALGLRETGGRSWPELLEERLRSLELLLVLDNLEHLVAGVAPLGELLAVAPRLRLLATSRTVLHLSAEQVFDVPPLERAAALQLFVRQTVAAGVAASTVSASRAAIERICERLDGSPLAIELAAPRLRALPPADLLRLLDSRLDALLDGPRDAPSRHQTLRSTFDWSFDLLNRDAQQLFARLSVFSSGFTLDAMSAVGGTDATIERLGALVDASLVQLRDGRHQLLEVMREYAAGRLGDDPEPHRRHADHFARLAETAERELSGTNQADWLRTLDAEHDNLRAALDWLAARDDAAAELRLAATLGRFWYVRGHIEEGLRRLRHAIDRAAGRDDPAVAKALRAASALALIRGDYPLARELADRALSVYRSLDDRAGVARTLSNLGAILHAQNELDLAAATLDECILDCSKLRDDRLLALAQNNRGDVALSQHDLDTATDHFERSLDILRALGDTANVARALYNLGAVAVEQERLDAARTLLGESIALAGQIGDSEDIAWCLIALAAVSSHTRKPLDGVRMLGFTTALLRQIGATMKPFEQDLHARTQQRLRSALGDHAFEEALEDGSRLALTDALELVSRLSP